MGWIIVNKDVLAELNWLFELQSRSGDKWRKDGHESLSEGKQAERKMKKIVVAQSTQRSHLTLLTEPLLEPLNWQFSDLSANC